MAGKKIETTADAVTLGPVSIPVATLLTLPAESAARNGIVLTNQRVKVNIMGGDDGKRPIEYTISLYVQRAPLTDDEVAAVHAQASQGDAKKRERAEAEARERERAVKAAFDMGQSATMSAIRNIGDLAAGAKALTLLK